MNLETILANADTAQEIVLRVARYEGKTPVLWQAIVKHEHSMAGPWSVAVEPTAVAALRKALGAPANPHGF